MMGKTDVGKQTTWGMTFKSSALPKSWINMDVLGGVHKAPRKSIHDWFCFIHTFGHFFFFFRQPPDF